MRQTRYIQTIILFVKLDLHLRRQAVLVCNLYSLRFWLEFGRRGMAMSFSRQNEMIASHAATLAEPGA